MSIVFQFINTLSFHSVESLTQNKYPDLRDLSDVPDDVSYSELDRVSVALVTDDLPLDIKPFVGKEIYGKYFVTGEYEVITEYSIESIGDDSRCYLVSCYTSFQ